MSKDRRSGRKTSKAAKTPQKNEKPRSARSKQVVSGTSGGDAAVVNEQKNFEMRWLGHYCAARKAIGSGDFQSALHELQSCVRFGEKLGDHRLANAYAEIGFVAMKLNEFATAREFFFLALKMRETIYGADHPSVAIEYNNLAMTYEWGDDYVHARPYLLKAVDVLDRGGKFDSADYAEPYEGLAAIYLAQGDFRRAEDYCMKALQIRDEVIGRLHPLSMKTVEMLLHIHRLSRNQDGAAAARAVYSQRLQDFASNTSLGAAAEAVKKLLDERESAVHKEKYDNCIGQFLGMIARR